MNLKFLDFPGFPVSNLIFFPDHWESVLGCRRKNTNIFLTSCRLFDYYRWAFKHRENGLPLVKLHYPIGWGLNYKQQNFIIIDVSDLKINVTKIGNKNWEVKASKLIYIKEQMWELVKSRAVWNIEGTNNFKICKFFEPNFDFSNWKKSIKLLIF